MNSRLSFFSTTRTSANPASTSMSTRSCVTGAPATQQLNASFVIKCSGSVFVCTTSATASLPPGLSTRNASRSTRGLSGDRLMTQLLTTTSIVASPAGRFSISPRRNSRTSEPRPRFSAPARALASMSGVMSTPTTKPSRPTSSCARKQSTPAPQPRSSTVSPRFSAARRTGVPHPTPRSASPATARSASVYPMAERLGVEETQHPPAWFATSA
mmetsp:Transcript_15243/g.64343  ORF Transcript_15243/g.64343 Transcript_15243/m.64343 type:complete len:214 (+) Transcript_15243:623-1264(+)